jgi:hypothetical protein
MAVMAAQIDGWREFTDGVGRPVYRDDRGQFVLDDGEPVYGQWLPHENDLADEPVVVPAG